MSESREPLKPGVVAGVLGAVLVLGVVVYGRSVGYGLLDAWDDGLYVLGRAEVRDWWAATWWRRLMTPETGYPVPLPTFLYAHARLLWPESYPQVLHGLNLAVHLGNVGLVFALVRRWSGRRMGLAVATLWALHPVGVETVAWVTNLKGLLFASCLLGALLVWERFLEAAPEARSGWRSGAAVLGLTVLALGCRPEAIVMPLLLGLAAWRRSDRAAVPVLVGLGVAVGVLGALYLPAALRGQEEVISGMRFGRGAGLWETAARVMLALEIAVRNVVVPLDLEPAYYVDPRVGVVDVLPGLAVLLGLVALGVGLAVRGRRDLLFAVLVGAVLYGPFSQLLPLTRLMADSYLYLPSMVALYFAIRAGAEVAGRWTVGGRAKKGRMAALGVLVAVAGGFAVKSYQQVGRWENQITLWQPLVVEHPTVWKPYLQVADGYRQRGEWEKAAAVVEEGLTAFRRQRTYPEFIGEVYDRAGQPRRALALAFEAARRHRAPVPKHFRNYLAVLARHDFPLPDHAEAEAVTERAVEVYADRPDFMASRQRRLSLAAYFLRRGYPEWAVPFVRREFESAEPHCAAWRFAGALAEGDRAGLEVPAVPERCS